MAASLSAARGFVYANARLVDARLFATLFEDASPDGVLRALDAYRNDDGGFGHGLEPDKRVPASQPLDVAVALELAALAGADAHDLAASTCAFLASVADGDGALPLCLPSLADYPHAPHFAGGWAFKPGLWATASVASWLHRFGVEDAWLARATAYCFAELERGPDLDAHGIRETLRFLIHVPDRERAEPLRATLLALLPTAAYFRADPASEEYGVSPLEFDEQVVDDAAVAAHLDRLESEQLPDGGWPIAWEPLSEASRFECRGTVTVRQLERLRRYGRL
jgi:hypothetical protein